jgi:hypothetical protein
MELSYGSDGIYAGKACARTWLARSIASVVIQMGHLRPTGLDESDF